MRISDWSSDVCSSDLAALSDIFKRSSGNNFMLDRWNPWPGVIEDAPASNAFLGGFQTRLMLKDLGLALANAQLRDASVPLGALVRTLFSLHAASAQDTGLQAFSSLQRFYAQSPQQHTRITRHQIIAAQHNFL